MTPLDDNDFSDTQPISERLHADLVRARAEGRPQPGVAQRQSGAPLPEIELMIERGELPEWSRSRRRRRHSLARFMRTLRS